MERPTLQELIDRIERLKGERAILREDHRRVHYQRVEQFKWAEHLHFIEPMFSNRPLPKSPTLPEEK